ncbi:MAG: glycosyltransferase family 4 protein [Actinobacteria bacterium]|nr:glycosyltransferase family 4 protein [Actinomycetota bacterium]
MDLTRVLGAQLLIAPLLIWHGFNQSRKLHPHVVYATSIHFFATLIAGLVAVITRKPLVVTAHLGDVESLGRLKRFVTQTYERTLGRLGLARATRVIAVSASVRDHLINIGVDEIKIVVVENGVNTAVFTPSALNIDQSEPPRDVAVVGRLIANKGVVEVAEAFRYVTSDVTLSFVGTGPLAAALRDMAKTDGRIVLNGQSDNVALILAAAPIFVRYSTTEGRSLALLEAMASGCAVVVSDIAANRDLIDHKRNGLVVPLGDPKKLAAAIDLLADDGQLRRKLGAAARADVGHLDWDSVARNTHKVISDAADWS